MAARQSTRPKSRLCKYVDMCLRLALTRHSTAGIFFLVRWVGEDSHSIVSSKDLDRSAAVVKTGESVKVKLQTTGTKMEWFEATVIACGKYIDATHTIILLRCVSH